MACRWLAQAEREPSLTQLASAARMSPFHFQRVFKSLVGVSPKQYARRHRLERFRSTLRNGHSVTQAIYAAGYAAPSRAYDDAKSSLGMQPSAYQNGGRGTVISFAARDTPLGWIIVAGTTKGVAHISFGDDPIRLRDQLREIFPRADFQNDDALAVAWMDQVQAYLKKPSGGLQLPVQLKGTDFQLRVWSALSNVGVGKRTTYSALAAKIGNPKAVRAVGTACGANPVPLAIPCHRALGKDGKLHGYRYGTKRKRWLLDAERSETTQQPSHHPASTPRGRSVSRNGTG
jgi:AraC family transcriptional regulator of adaptative response/methylated-DNA-[protein]-cysteine methyltransferase